MSASVHLTILGCSGSECGGDHPCSFLVGDHILIDAGSAASALNLEQQQKIQHVFITHAHLDHIKDLAFLGENILPHQQAPIQVHAHPEVLAAIRQHVFNGVLWPDFTVLPSEDRPVFQFRAIAAGESVKLENVSIEAVPVHHGPAALGFLLHGGKHHIAISGDTGPTDTLWQMVERDRQVSDVLVEVTFPNHMKSLADSAAHLTPSLLEQELQKLSRQDIRVHVYHLKQPFSAEIQREIAALDDSRVRILATGDRLLLS